MLATRRMRAPWQAPHLGGLAVGLGFVICWSSGFVGSRLAIAVESPVLSLYAWRFALATLLAALWALATYRGRIALAPAALGHEALVGSLTVGGYLLAMLLAVESGVGAGVAALIGALQPLAATLLAGRLLGERPQAAQWLGLVGATLGAGLSVMDDLDGMGGAPLWAYGLPLLAVAAVSLGSVMSAGRPATLPMATRLTAQLAAATLVFAFAALLRGEGLSPPPVDRDTLAALAWLIALATFGGYGFFNASLQRFGVSRSAALVALTPAATLAATALMFGERPGMLGAAGMALGLVGAGAALLGGRPRGRGAGGHVATARPIAEREARRRVRPSASATRRG
ncbi:DMT family transporter [Halomonas getboli]|uniref:DMT family transporter n=1 Tax=Halomonas getboli TaxID=2935862 RepID=UPI001FFE3A84|nr:DMT family transporter [Halomonas getboli]MCK2185663.1 DMT family transporter [Halomonas getboli]